MKSINSAGGSGVQRWSSNQTLDRRHYLQERIEGTPVGAVFVVDAGGHCHVAGATRQIIGDAALGSREFRYCGSIGPVGLAAAQLVSLAALGQALVNACSLRGVFGVDLILQPDGVLRPLEVNPRYPASTEVLERAGDLAVLRGCHTAVNATHNAVLSHRASDGPAPRSDSHDRHERKCDVAGHVSGCMAVHGKAIVFARCDGTAPDLYRWFDPADIADVPAIGEPLLAGKPICTLFAAGRDHDDCLQRLHARADDLYTRLS